MTDSPQGALPFDGTIMIVAPHMDDETLGCGQLLASRTALQPSHVIFATDGAASHDELQGDDTQSLSGLPALRKAEATLALSVLGVPAGHIEFLDFPDGRLTRHAAELAAAIAECARRLQPDFVFVPFRYDRHPDHIAVNRAVTIACSQRRLNTRVVEYFVYWQWRLLATGDVRDYLVREDLVRVDLAQAAERKRRALACYQTQTSRYFDGQRRPVLDEALIERVCTSAEIFLRQRPDRRGRHALARSRAWVPLAHRLEPVLKRFKDQLVGQFTR